MKSKNRFFLNLFSWNRYEIHNFQLVEKRKNTKNNFREFSFQIDKNYLDKVTSNFVISCKDSTQTEYPIRIDVNDYTIANFIPDCLGKFKSVSREIPLNILNEKNNKLILSTNGYYKLAYNFNKIYFNDKSIYYFNIDEFDDDYEQIIVGEFDDRYLDVRINNNLINLEDSQIVDISGFLKIGKNKLEILTKPIKIKELYIENNRANDESYIGNDNSNN